MCSKGSSEAQITDYIEQALLAFKKVRLIEDKLSFEDLIVEDQYSDEEVTITLNRQLLKDRKDKQALIKVKILQRHVTELKALTLQSMGAIVDTMVAVDESSKKMAYSHFDQQETNIIASQSADLIRELNRIVADASVLPTKLYDSDEISSDASGNNSENDEINQIVEMQKKHKQHNHLTSPVYSNQDPSENLRSIAPPDEDLSNLSASNEGGSADGHSNPVFDYMLD